MFNTIIPKIKYGMFYGFSSGFFLGCFPNKIYISFEEKTYRFTPILSGIIGSMGILCSPLFIINYLYNGVYFDKLVDNYHIRIKRYYQYDSNHNKYAFPSVLIININPI
jgi:hypothetical protein